MSRVAIALAAALVVLVGAQSTPAEAGKIGNTIAKTATKAAVKAAVKGGKKDRGDKDDDDDAPVRSSVQNQSVGGDADSRAAHAKTKLEDETGPKGTVLAGATDLSADTNAGIVCLAGCN
jgi:hypothetical protein